MSSSIDMSSSMHIDNKGKNILSLGKGPKQGLDGTTFTAETLNAINFTQSRKRFVYTKCVSLSNKNCKNSSSPYYSTP